MRCPLILYILRIHAIVDHLLRVKEVEVLGEKVDSYLSLCIEKGELKIMESKGGGTEAQKYIWEGAIPLQIHLHESEVTTLPPPPPAMVLLFYNLANAFNFFIIAIYSSISFDECPRVLIFVFTGF